MYSPSPGTGKYHISSFRVSCRDECRPVVGKQDAALVGDGVCMNVSLPGHISAALRFTEKSRASLTGVQAYLE